jgi:hypothetical protein
MKTTLLILLIAIGLYGCNIPTELPVPERAKPADKFARKFIDKLLTGQLDSAFSDIDPETLNDQSKEFISNTTKNINGAKVKKYIVVEVNSTTGLTANTGEFTTYRLAYEYQFEKGYVLFTTTIKQKDSQFSILAFNGEFLSGPLVELTKFTLKGKTIIHYVFLVFFITVPIFLLATLSFMLFSKMTVKKKLVWAFIIILVSLPRFTINWGNGQFDFALLNFSLQGSSFYKPTLYSFWLLSFNIPIGAIVFWFKRRSLLSVGETNNREAISNTHLTDNEKTIAKE